MIEMLDLAGPWARALLGTGFDVAVRSSVVVALALVVHGVLGRRRVLVRSVLWNACLLGLLALPAAVAGIPHLRISWRTDPAATPRVEPAAAQPVPGPIAIARESHADAASTPGDVPPLHSTAVTPARLEPRVAVARPAARWSLPRAASILVLVYAVVAAALLIRLAVSLQGVRRLTRTSLPVEGGPWADAMALWSGRLGLTRPVGLARAARLGGPVIVGWLRPTIVLPEELAASATPAVIDAVIVHELAHVRRGDYGWNLVLRLVQAAYWPQPLVWVLGPIVAAVREQACDELCVYWTGDARGYRATLLAIAESLVRRPREALGLAMSRPTRLGRRLAHLATTQGASRCVLRGPARGLIVLAVLAAAGLLGSIRFARSATAQQPAADPAPKAATKPAEKAEPDTKPAPSRPREPESQPEPKPKDEPKPEAEADTKPNDAPRPDERVVDVTIEKPRREPWTRLMQANGNLQHLNPSPVHARVAGVVAAKGLASVGDRVKKGDVLAEIEATDLPVELGKARSALRQATARRKQATAAVAVAKAAAEAASAKIDEAKLALKQAREGNVGTVATAESRLRSANAAQSQAAAEQLAAEAGVDAADADLLDAQAEIERVDGRFAFTKVRSPIDGIVSKRNVDAGSPALPGQATPVFVVARTDVLQTSILVDESMASQVEPGQDVQFRQVGMRTLGQPIRAKVQRVAAEIQGGKLRVDVDVPNPDGHLLPGATGMATIMLEPPHEAITIPVRALRFSDEEGGGRGFGRFPRADYLCYRVSGGRAVATPIKLGLSDGTRIEILEGLNGDESLIADMASNGKLLDLDAMAPQWVHAQFLNSPRVNVVELPKQRSAGSRRGLSEMMMMRMQQGPGQGGSPIKFK